MVLQWGNFYMDKTSRICYNSNSSNNDDNNIKVMTKINIHNDTNNSYG